MDSRYIQTRTPPRVASLLLGLAFALSPARGQTISYLRELSRTQYEQAIGMAADAAGTYTVAWEGPDRFSPVGLLRKYDARGNELWSRRLEGNPLSDVAVDAAGSVYVVGPGVAWERSIFVSKFSSQGALLWTREAGRGWGARVASDTSGVYMAWTLAEGPRLGVAIRKYSTDGDVLWTARPVFSPTSFENSADLAANATGVYLASSGGVEQRSASFLRAFTADGQELWTRRFADGNPSNLAADASGVYAVDVWPGLLRKYNLSGDELWTRKVGTRDSLAAVAVDASGVYVGGFAEQTLPGQCASGSNDAVVHRYTATGEEIWTRQFGLPATEDVHFGAIAVAAVAVDASSVYLTGHTRKGKTILARIEKAPVVIPSTRPHIYWDCVVNAASYVGGGVAPGEIVTIFGSAIGPSELLRLRLAENGRLATSLADTRILFNGVPAPLLFVSAQQSTAIVPYAVVGRTSVDVQVEYKGVRSDAVTMPVLASRPGIFTLDASGRGQGAILNEDGSLNSPSNPAQRGSIVTIYVTGGGEAAPGILDGQILSGVLPVASLPVSAFFDIDFPDAYEPKEGEVLYAGGATGSVAGLLQVNVRMPANAEARGDAVPFALRIGSEWTTLQAAIALR